MVSSWPSHGATLGDLVKGIFNPARPPQGLQSRMASCLEALLARDPSERPANGAAAERLLRAALREALPLDALLRLSFSPEQEIEWEREGPRYRVRLRLPGGRRHTLFVEEPGDLLLIWGACCPARANRHEYALRLNAEIAHGAVCIRDVESVPTFVVVETYPRTSVDVEALRRSVVEVAQRAEEVAGLLARTDEQ